RRNFQPLAPGQADRLFQDCEPGSHPPLASTYQIPAILEEALLGQEELYLQSGCHTTMLLVDKASFTQINSRARRTSLGRKQEGLLMLPSCQIDEAPGAGPGIQKITERLKRLYKLPPMPSVAARILQIVADPNSNVKELARVIEQDASLAAQVMRYARSAL